MVNDRARNEQSEPLNAGEPGVRPGEAARAQPPLSTAEAAAALELSEQAVRRAIARGDLPAVKRGSGYRINAEELARYAQKLHRPIPLIPRARIVALPNSADVLPSFQTPASPLIGRDGELASLSTLLDDSSTRLITLTGLGGIGKTRLALAIVASMEDRFADGALFVDLSDTTSPADVIPAIAQAFGLRERAGQDRRSQLIAFLRGKHLLLVLDNFEQIIDAAPEVTELCAQAPRVTILITSRAPLRVRGEREMPVPPLTLAGSNAAPDELLASEAGRLFVARAQDHNPAFAVDAQSAPVIAEICARLDGLPLAIELAAARCRVLPPRQLRDRLERRLPLLTRGPRDAPPRHQTMRDAIAWSYDLLQPEEQALFRHLAIFAGGCSLEAAEAISYQLSAISSREDGALASTPPITHHPITPSPSSDPLDMADALLDQSLLVREFGVDGEPRFRMLETIREYGLERTDPREAEAMRAAHAHYFLEMARELRPLVTTEATRTPLDRLAADDANLRAALVWLDDHGPAADFVALVASLCCYWYALSLLPEAESWFARALDKRFGAPQQDRAQLMIGYAELMILRGEDGKAEEAFAEGLPILREAGSPFDLAIAVMMYGALLNYGGQYSSAEAPLGEALALAEAIDNEVLRAAVAGAALSNLSDSARGRGDLELAATHGEEALRRQAGRHLDLAETRVQLDLAGIAKDQGDHRLAVERCLACLARMGERGDMRLIADALSGIATAATVWSQHRTALLLFAAADAQRERLGIAMSLPSDVAATARHLATLRQTLGEEVFAITWAEGRAMSLEGALAIAATVAPPSEAPQVTQPPVASPLTRREQEVLRLLVAGQTDREIAVALFIGARTVSWHVGSIIGKLAATTRREAVHRARADGWV